MRRAILILLLYKPVLDHGRCATGLGGIGVLALDLDGHALVLLQAAGQIRLLGRPGLLGLGKDVDMAGRVGILDRGGLVRFELLEVELLDEVGWR